MKSSETFEPKQSSLTFGEFSERWLRDYCTVEKAPSQLVENTSVIRRHLLPTFGDVHLKRLTKSHLISLKVALAQPGRKLRPKTVNHVLALAKTMLATAVDWELLSANAFKGVDLLPVGDQPFDHWRPEERDFVSRHGRRHDPEFTSAVVVACHTGLRRGELAGLRRRHLDFERRLIEVGEVYCFKSHRFLETTKNKTRVFIPMSETVYKELATKKLMAPDAPVFGPTLLRHAVQRLGRLSKAIGVKVIRYHDLRHTFASCLVSANVPIYTVQKLMRHKTIAMTQRYAHLAPSYLADAIEAIAPKNDRPDSAPIGSLECRSLGDQKGILEPQTGLERVLTPA
jgi:integrase